MTIGGCNICTLSGPPALGLGWELGARAGEHELSGIRQEAGELGFSCLPEAVALTPL